MKIPTPWESHIGLDYAVVMLPGETTDDASIRVSRENAPELIPLISTAPELLEALETFVSEYVALVESGDAGNWDAETEPKVIAARAAIAKAHGQ